MFRLAIFKQVLLGLVSASLLAGLFLTAAPAEVVTAASDPAVTQNQGDAKAAPRLERLYKVELRTLDRQGRWIDATQRILDRVKQLVDKFLSRDIDVASLRAALDQFKAGVLDARAKHASAAAILASHKGFDGDGKVIDRKASTETVRTAGQDLRQAATTYRKAVVELRRSIRLFIRDNRPPKPEVTPQAP